MVSRALTIPRTELSERFSRSSGPGGQGVNTTDSRVDLFWDVGRSTVLTPVQRDRIVSRLGDRLVDGVLTVSASEHREQRRNRDAAARRWPSSLPKRSLHRPGHAAPPARPTASGSVV
ncbi:alternative ribosome rescue aminoacyl-tRNA hydrolase ArfB [Isoptericola nanjingensis]